MTTVTNTVVGYKIRRKDGRYSTGGSTPEFTYVGKTWSNTAGLHSHFTCIEEFEQTRARNTKRPYTKGDGVKRFYHDCELVKLTESDHVGIKYYFEAIGR